MEQNEFPNESNETGVLGLGPSLVLAIDAVTMQFW